MCRALWLLVFGAAVLLLLVPAIADRFSQSLGLGGGVAGPVFVTMVTRDKFDVELRALLGSVHGFFPAGTVTVFGVGLTASQVSELGIISAVDYIEIYSPDDWAGLTSVWQRQDMLMGLKHEVLRLAADTYPRFSFIDVNAFLSGRAIMGLAEAHGGGGAGYARDSSLSSEVSYVFQESCKRQPTLNETEAAVVAAAGGAAAQSLSFLHSVSSFSSAPLFCVEIGPHAPVKVDVEWQFNPTVPQQVADVRCLLHLDPPKPKRQSLTATALRPMGLQQDQGGGSLFVPTPLLNIVPLRALPVGEEPTMLFDQRQKVCVSLVSSALGGALAGVDAPDMTADEVFEAMKPLLASLRQASSAASGRLVFALYVGSGVHPVFDSSHGRRRLTELLEWEMGQTALAVTIVRLSLGPAPEPHLVTVSNTAVSVGFEDDCHFFLRLFEPVPIDPAWAPRFATKLGENNNLGMVVPQMLPSEGGGPQPQAIAAFAARRHVEMLGFFDPPSLFYWFTDAFAASLYGPEYTYALLPQGLAQSQPAQSHCHVHACLVNPELRAARERVASWLRQFRPQDRTAIHTMETLLDKCEPSTYACQRALQLPPALC